LIQTFDAIAQIQTPSEYAALCEHVGVDNPPPLDQNHPLAGVVYDWLKNIHFWPLMRILDIFIIEGTEIFYRMGMVVLQRWYQSVTCVVSFTPAYARRLAVVVVRGSGGGGVVVVVVVVGGGGGGDNDKPRVFPCVCTSVAMHTLMQRHPLFACE